MENGDRAKNSPFLPNSVRKRKTGNLISPSFPLKKFRPSISVISTEPLNEDSDGNNSSLVQTFSTPPRSRINRESGNFSAGSPFPNFSPSVFNSPSLNGPASSLTPRHRRIFKTKDCPECDICSDDVFEIRHPHFSTQKTTPKRGGHYFCRLCRKNHSKESSRLNVVLSSSTLHNLWKNPSFKPDQHIDFDTIIGGRIHDIHASFLYQYSELTSPMDIILVCGVNNVPTEDTSQQMIQQFESLIKTIKNQSIQNNHKIPNRIVLCTVLYSPKTCDKSIPPHLNMTQKVREVNNWIHEFNESETGEHLKLHLNGVYGDPDTENLVHRYDEWREPEIKRKLHLTNEVKDRVATQVIQLFRKIKQNDH